MFKKPFKVSQSNQLANKDRKRLMADLKKQFPPEVIQLIFSTYDKFQIEKITGQKMLIYKNESYPAFFDPQGKSEYIPSLYVIAEFPELLPSLLINEGVDYFLVNGANLMWRGVVKQELQFKKNDLRAIVTTQGRQIQNKIISLVAIGSMVDDSTEVDIQEGVAAFTFHTIGDHLWEYGPKIVIEPKLLQIEQNQVIIQEEEQQDLDGLEQKTQINDETQDIGMSQYIQDGNDSEDDPNNKRKNKNKKQQSKSQKVDSSKQKENEAEKEKEDENENKQSTQINQLSAIDIKAMDDYTKEAFLNTLSLGLKEIQFPIDSSLFFSNHMLHYKNQDVILDFKNSSYKKVGKFFSQMHKEGFIDYKEANKSQQTMIMSVNKQHKELINWKPTVQAQSVKIEESKKEEPYGFQPEIQIIELFKPRKTITALFREQPPDRFYTRDEWMKILDDYIAKECKWQKKQVKLLDFCLIMLFPQVMRQEQIQPMMIGQSSELQQNAPQLAPQQQSTLVSLQNDLVNYDVLVQKVQDNMTLYHEITHLATMKTELKYFLCNHKRSGQFKGLHIKAERCHNKNVTRLNGLEIFGFDSNLKDNHPNSFDCLIETFQVRFACSVSVCDAPNKGSKEMIIHGNFIDEVVQFFKNQCQINENFIQLVNKLQPKKKLHTRR